MSVPLLASLCRASQFFSAPALRGLRERVRRFAPVSAVPCIPRAPLRPAPARSVLGRDFLRRVRRVREAVQEGRRAALVSATCREGSKKAQ